MLLFLGNISKEHKTGIHNRVKPQKFSTVLEKFMCGCIQT